jgi:hypothetical protein
MDLNGQAREGFHKAWYIGNHNSVMVAKWKSKTLFFNTIKFFKAFLGAFIFKVSQNL